MISWPSFQMKWHATEQLETKFLKRDTEAGAVYWFPKNNDLAMEAVSLGLIRGPVETSNGTIIVEGLPDYWGKTITPEYKLPKSKLEDAINQGIIDKEASFSPINTKTAEQDQWISVPGKHVHPEKAQNSSFNVVNYETLAQHLVLTEQQFNVEAANNGSFTGQIVETPLFKKSADEMRHAITEKWQRAKEQFSIYTFDTPEERKTYIRKQLEKAQQQAPINTPDRPETLPWSSKMASEYSNRQSSKLI